MKNKIINNKKIIIIILLLAASLIATFFITMGFDYYWHITAGKYMINNHTILTTDIFSWYLKDVSWMSHEWLYECIIYGLKIIFGSSHTIIYCFLNIFILLSILFLHNKDNYSKNTIFTLIWLALYFFLNVGLIAPRPQLISSWLIALTLYLLYDLKKNENSKKIYFLPLVTLFWANVHGGSSNLSYLLCLLFIIVGLLKIEKKNIKTEKLTKKQLKKYFIVLILTILVININPHGYKMLIYPYENILNKFMQQNISEWHPTSLLEPYHYVYLLTILMILIIILKSKKKIRLVDLLLFVVFSYMGLRSIRFWNYIYIGASFFVFKYIKPRKQDPNTQKVFLIFSMILILIFIVKFKDNKEKLVNNKIITNVMIKEIKKENPKRLFNLYDYGGYLIYKDIKVFVDGRADLYSKYNYRDYVNISNYEKNTEKLINKYNFDYFIVNKRFKIYDYLKENDQYVGILDDGYSILYKKKDT